MPLPEFPVRLKTLEVIQSEAPTVDVHADIEDVLLAADEHGVVDVASENAKKARDARANLVREKTILGRLKMLGYLPRSKRLDLREDPLARAMFVEAVRKFQGEAGLVQDGWVGDQSWRTLQQLITFECPTDVPKFLSQGVPMPSLVRALRLRLCVLGFLATEPIAGSAGATLPTVALRSFWRMMKRLGIVSLEAPKPEVPDLIALVFDQDKLVAGTARSSKRLQQASRPLVFVWRALPGDDASTTKSTVRKFIVCLTKIELWLLGFDIEIEGKEDYSVGGIGNLITPGSRIKVALTEFWEKLRARIPSKYRKRFLRVITPELLKALSAPPGSGSLASRRCVVGDYSQVVAMEVDTEEKISAAWEYGTGRRRSMVGRLWDGLGRLWRWLKRGVKKILRIGNNIFRAFYRYALKAHQIMRFAARTVVSSLGQYLRGVVDTGDGVKVTIDHDGDFGAVIDARVSHSQLSEARTAILYFGKAFFLATRILSVILRAVKSAAVGVLGWVRVLYLLVRAYGELRPLYRELRSLALKP